MKPQKRYFKCHIDIEPIKSLNEQWVNDREKRNKKLKAIFDTIPFYEGWHGDENEFPSIPDFLTEIKHSEFLAIQAE